MEMHLINLRKLLGYTLIALSLLVTALGSAALTEGIVRQDTLEELNASIDAFEMDDQEREMNAGLTFLSTGIFLFFAGVFLTINRKSAKAKSHLNPSTSKPFGNQA
jgi:hypothetical protein